MPLSNVTLPSSSVPTYPDVLVGPVSPRAPRVVKTKVCSMKAVSVINKGRLMLVGLMGVSSALNDR